MDVALRAAHETNGSRLPSGRIISGLVVPKHFPARSSGPGWVSMGGITSDLHFPDAEPVDLMWSHGRDARIGRAGVVGKVLRTEHTSAGLAFWADVDNSAQGDEILRAVGFGEIGCSVGLADDMLSLQGEMSATAESMG